MDRAIDSIKWSIARTNNILEPRKRVEKKEDIIGIVAKYNLSKICVGIIWQQG